MFTLGHVELRARVRERMKKHGINQNDCANLVSCNTGNFSRLLNNEGKRKYVLPGAQLAGRIEAVFKVKTISWSIPATNDVVNSSDAPRVKRAGGSR